MVFDIYTTFLQLASFSMCIDSSSRDYKQASPPVKPRRDEIRIRVAAAEKIKLLWLDGW